MDDLERQVDLNPGGPFLETRAGSLSYGEVERLVGLRARELGERGGGQVVVRPRIEVDSIVELLAVTRSGATAVVVSPDLPDDQAAARTRYVANESRPSRSILFTSGSSGAAKGVRLTDSNWDAATRASIYLLGHGSSDRWLCALPLHHVGGLSVVYRTLAAGGMVVLAPEAADVAAWIGGVGFASLVPTQLHRMLEGRTDAFTSRPVVLVGGAPARPGLLDQAETAGMIVLPTYGMTETTAQAATARPGDPHRRLFALDGVQIRTGAADRIELRGPTVFPGYAGEPEREPDDWFSTADRGRIDDDGSLLVLGRLDRHIISGGENVDPTRIESAIRSHHGVLDVAVVGLADEEWGQVVAAAYAGSVTPHQLWTFIRDRLQPHEVPKLWLQVEDLPRSGLGKIDHAGVMTLFDR